MPLKTSRNLVKPMNFLAKINLKSAFILSTLQNMEILATSEKPLFEQLHSLLKKYDVPEDEIHSIVNDCQEKSVALTQDDLESIFEMYNVDIADRYIFLHNFTKRLKGEMQKIAISQAVVGILSQGVSHSI
jgi:hypothetical protein